MPLNYHHLRYFWAVAHEGNLTRTAQRLNLSQSALSVQIKQLEDRLGHALFERRGRQLHLTEAGRIALDYADTIFGAGQELIDTLRRTGKSTHIGTSGRIHDAGYSLVDYNRAISDSPRVTYNDGVVFSIN